MIQCVESISLKNSFKNRFSNTHLYIRLVIFNIDAKSKLPEPSFRHKIHSSFPAFENIMAVTLGRNWPVPAGHPFYRICLHSKAWLYSNYLRRLAFLCTIPMRLGLFLIFHGLVHEYLEQFLCNVNQSVNRVHIRKEEIFCNFHPWTRYMVLINLR